MGELKRRREKGTLPAAFDSWAKLMALYASVNQLRRRIPKAANDADTENELTEILGAVSRAIDHYCYVPENYFTPAAEDPEAKIIYGKGRSYLTLPHFLWGDVTISAPAGSSVPNFRVDGQRIITLTDENTRSPYVIFTSGLPYTVTGRWGFVETPEDIREAALQTGVRWWRGKDEAFSGVIGGINKDNTIVERDLPAPVRTILQNWRRKSRRVYVA